ncbi:MAG TPA: aminopeptidase, partial [Desulfatirhabdiaceae bacterium]|nr:aminopeptidase [Desulfatirhabdiaceae bacterium]
RYADVLIWGLKTARAKPFKKQDVILIRYEKPGINLVEILYDKLLRQGYHPIPRLGLSVAMEKSFYHHANAGQLTFIPPGERELYERLNGNIYVNAPESITHLQAVDPKRIGKSAVARKILRDIMTGREEKGELGWTLCVYPTEELARHAQMSLEEYTAQIIRACYLDHPDPTEQWKGVYKKAMIIKKWLNSLDVQALHIESERTDLMITPGKKRKWIGVTGHNIPSFELFISPDWRGTRGVYFADQPSYRSGNYVKNICLEFEKGKVIHVSADTGEEFIIKQLAMDTGANRIGEFSLTDKRFSRIDRFMASTLFDENYGGQNGNCHIAVGSSYSDTYDGNPAELTPKTKQQLGFNDSALHWDLVNTEPKQITAHLIDGSRVLIYQNGEFCYS